MKFVIAALVFALTTAAAYAQEANPGMAGGGGGGHNRHQQQSADKSPQKPKVDDKAYRDALKSLPDKPYDPWQGAR